MYPESNQSGYFFISRDPESKIGFPCHSQDHSGRTVLEEESLHTIPLHTHSGVVLMPGEVLPLHIHHPHTISMMNSIIETHR